MTQFESKLQSMIAELDSQQQDYEREEWAKIENSTLADYRKEQENVCNEGIAALQEQRDTAIANKKEQLFNKMKADAEKRFSLTRQKLEDALSSFSSNDGG